MSSNKSTDKTLLQKIGIALFSLALFVFIASLSLSHYTIDTTALKDNIGNDYHWSFIEPHIAALDGKNTVAAFLFLVLMKEP